MLQKIVLKLDLREQIWIYVNQTLYVQGQKHILPDSSERGRVPPDEKQEPIICIAAHVELEIGSTFILF